MLKAKFTHSHGQTFSLDVDVSLSATGATAVFGHSGSGKTTLLKLMSGLLKSRGKCCFNGNEWSTATTFVPVHQRRLGYIFQQPALFSHLSVQKNINYGRRFIKNKRPEFALERVVSLFNLSALLERSVVTLSGGEKQRVALARALCAEPSILFLDEPLTGLDKSSKNEILTYLNQIKRKFEIPIIYVSHDLYEVAALCDSMLILKEGKIYAHGATEQLLTQLDLTLDDDKASSVLRGTINKAEVMPGISCVRVDDVELLLSRSSEPEGAHVAVRIHARDVSIALRNHDDTSIMNIIACTISDFRVLENNSVLVRLSLSSGQSFLSHITFYSFNLLHLKVGMAVYAQVKAVALLS